MGQKRIGKDWAPTWLEAFSRTRRVVDASKVVGLTRDAPYKRRQVDEEFARAWDEIKSEWWETRLAELEESAIDRAIHGTVRTSENGVENRYHETALTIFMLKAKLGYRDGHEVDDQRGVGGVTINLHKGAGARVEIPEENDGG